MTVQTERQQSDSNTNSIFEFEPALEKSGATVEPSTRTAEPPKTYPLGLVLKACPEIADYAVDGIANWRDFMATAAQVRGYLGVSPSAYEDACHVMGQETAAIVDRLHPATGAAHQFGWRLSAGADRQGQGRGVFCRADANQPAKDPRPFGRGEGGVMWVGAVDGVCLS